MAEFLFCTAILFLVLMYFIFPMPSTYGFCKKDKEFLVVLRFYAVIWGLFVSFFVVGMIFSVVGCGGSFHC